MLDTTGSNDELPSNTMRQYRLPVDQRTLGVGLEYRAFHPQTFALLYNLRIDGCQRVRTINARFALTGQVQVRTVDQ